MRELRTSGSVGTAGEQSPAVTRPGFIPLLADLAVWISPVAEGLQGTARAAAEVPRPLANANTLFNVANTVLFLGLTAWFARLAVGLSLTALRRKVSLSSLTTVRSPHGSVPGTGASAP
jgi:hypothetical protein